MPVRHISGGFRLLITYDKPKRSRDSDGFRNWGTYRVAVFDGGGGRVLSAESGIVPPPSVQDGTVGPNNPYQIDLVASAFARRLGYDQVFRKPTMAGADRPLTKDELAARKPPKPPKGKRLSAAAKVRGLKGPASKRAPASSKRPPPSSHNIHRHGDPKLGPSGYQNCQCRDCFEQEVGHPGLYCDKCLEAGCPDYQGVKGMSQECQRQDLHEGVPARTLAATAGGKT